MRSRSDHGKSEQEGQGVNRSTLVRATSTALAILFMLSAFTFRSLKSIILTAIGVLSVSSLTIGYYLARKLRQLSLKLVTNNNKAFKRLARLLSSNEDRGVAFLRTPLLKSGAALTLILVTSLYSYAFHSDIAPPPESGSLIIEVAVPQDSPGKVAASEDMASEPNVEKEPLHVATLAPPARPTPSKATIKIHAAPDIESFKGLYEPGALVNISRGRRDVKELSLTFDGGGANHAREILGVLRDKGIETTLFLTGRFIKKNPEIVMQMLADGHEIGNHTMNHPHLTDFNRTRAHRTLERVTKEYLLDEILTTARLYRELTGQEMAPFWRAPYGEINKEITQWAYNAGFLHVGWTADYKNKKSLDTLDWVKDKDSKNYYTAEEIRNRILDFDTMEAGLKGAIILMHLGTSRRDEKAVSVLPDIIDDLRERGYNFVKISQMTAAKFPLAANKSAEIPAIATPDKSGNNNEDPIKELLALMEIEED